MRRISIHRPKEKIRGVERRLRALDLWANQFENCKPYYDGQNYWNYKIPVIDRLVCPPTTNFEIQKRALQSLVKAVKHLSDSKVSQEVDYYRVAILVTFPHMFHSEVTAFFSREYYESFCYTQNLLPVSKSPSKHFNIEIPDGFQEVGTLVEWEDEYEEKIIKISEERWTIGQTP